MIVWRGRKEKGLFLSSFFLLPSLLCGDVLNMCKREKKKKKGFHLTCASSINVYIGMYVLMCDAVMCFFGSLLLLCCHVYVSR